ncbi:MAG: hypothetical protein PVF68_16435, partial [Acidobacteriota bacterium]
TLYTALDVYRGDLVRLPDYTQPSGGMAAQLCDHGQASIYDPFVPPAGTGVFYLVAGHPGGGLGIDSDGNSRIGQGNCS